MIVTNRDAYIASYAIASYAKLHSCFKNQYEWKLLIYANCLTKKLKKKLFPVWYSYPYVEIYDNAQHCLPSDFIPGSFIEDGNGGRKTIQGPFENGAAIWTREFAAFNSNYWATVDADFEILCPDFVRHALRRLEDEENLVVMSSDRSDTKYKYCTFGKEHAYIMWRHPTWFCIYKKKAQQCNVSHYFYQYQENGSLYKIDDGGRLQHSLVQEHGFELGACTVGCRNMKFHFIHYGGFAKNKSLNSPLKTSLYRLICLWSHYGILSVSRKSIVNKYMRKVASFVKKVLYNKALSERGAFSFQNQMDKE
jgi:hypothetical protein